MDFAARAGMSGIQEWLSFTKVADDARRPVPGARSVWSSSAKLRNTLRYTKGDELITHLGAEYYD